MATGEKEKIFSNSIHLKFCMMFHGMEIQCHKKICATQRAAWMTALAGMNHTDDVSSDLGGKLLKLLNVSHG